jgi:hypothetical protein
VENALWKRLRTCHKTAYGTKANSHYAARHDTTKRNIFLWFWHARIHSSRSRTGKDKNKHSPLDWKEISCLSPPVDMNARWLLCCVVSCRVVPYNVNGPWMNVNNMGDKDPHTWMQVYNTYISHTVLFSLHHSLPLLISDPPDPQASSHFFLTLQQQRNNYLACCYLLLPRRVCGLLSMKWELEDAGKNNYFPSCSLTSFSKEQFSHTHTHTHTHTQKTRQ